MVALVVALLAALALAPAAQAFNPQTAGLQIVLSSAGSTGERLTACRERRRGGRSASFSDAMASRSTDWPAPVREQRSGPSGSPLFGTRVIRRGRSGYDVGVLQFLLARRGLRPGRLDGRFGAQTETAVRRFQRSKGLLPDGVVGRRTARLLCALPACTWRAAPRRKPEPAAPDQPWRNPDRDLPALRSQRQCHRAREPGRPGPVHHWRERGSAFRARRRGWR